MRMGLKQRMAMLAAGMRIRIAGAALAGALLGGGMLLAPAGVWADEVAKTFTVAGTLM